MSSYNSDRSVRGRRDERRPGPFVEHESPRDERSAQAVRARRSRRRRSPGLRWAPILLVVALIAGAGAAIAFMAPRDAKRARASVSAVWSAVATSAISAATTEPAPVSEPTPFFATLRGVRLRLPVQPTRVTVLAFHRSSYRDSLPVRPLIGFTDASDAKTAAQAARAADTSIRSTPTGTPAADAQGIWTGRALELWRTGAAGERRTAVDCGARHGSTVYSPVDGTVMRVHPYHLYGRYSDIEIQIKPDAWDDVDVFILHVIDAQVTEGQRVVAGVTPVARVRHLSKVMSGIQLRTYTTDGGNHTHVQFNRIPKPDVQWLVGQDAPGFKGRK